MKKQISLTNLPETPVKQLIALPIETLSALLDEAKEQKRHHATCCEWLEGVLAEKYKNPLTKARKTSGKQTGIVHIEDDGYVVSQDMQKKVEWDQTALQKIVDILKKKGDQPQEYIGMKYSVSETRYQSWPEKIRVLFTPARKELPPRGRGALSAQSGWVLLCSWENQMWGMMMRLSWNEIRAHKVKAG